MRIICVFILLNYALAQKTCTELEQDIRSITENIQSNGKKKLGKPTHEFEQDLRIKMARFALIDGIRSLKATINKPIKLNQEKIKETKKELREFQYAIDIGSAFEQLVEPQKSNDYATALHQYVHQIDSANKVENKELFKIFCTSQGFNWCHKISDQRFHDELFAMIAHEQVIIQEELAGDNKKIKAHQQELQKMLELNGRKNSFHKLQSELKDKIDNFNKSSDLNALKIELAQIQELSAPFKDPNTVGSNSIFNNFKSSYQKSYRNLHNLYIEQLKFKEPEKVIQEITQNFDSLAKNFADEFKKENSNSSSSEQELAKIYKLKKDCLLKGEPEKTLQCLQGSLNIVDDKLEDQYHELAASILADENKLKRFHEQESTRALFQNQALYLKYYDHRCGPRVHQEKYNIDSSCDDYSFANQDLVIFKNISGNDREPRKIIAAIEKKYFNSWQDSDFLESALENSQLPDEIKSFVSNHLVSEDSLLEDEAPRNTASTSSNTIVYSDNKKISRSERRRKKEEMRAFRSEYEANKPPWQQQAEMQMKVNTISQIAGMVPGTVMGIQNINYQNDMFIRQQYMMEAQRQAAIRNQFMWGFGGMYNMNTQQNTFFPNFEFGNVWMGQQSPYLNSTQSSFSIYPPAATVYNFGM